MTQKINIDLQKELKSSDSDLFDKIIKLSDLVDALNYKRYEITMEEQYKRYQLLISGMEAGNQAEEIKSELITILKLFIRKKVIDNKEGIESGRPG